MGVTNGSKVGTLLQTQGTFSDATADTNSSQNEQNFASPQIAKESVSIDNAAYESFHKSRDDKFSDGKTSDPHQNEV